MCPHDPQVTNPPCPVCQIFGGSGLQSRLFFGDAVTKADGNMAPYLARVQAGVALSRKRRTAEDERLYYIERGVEGLVYAGTIDGYLEDNLATQQVALIIAAIERLVAIGGSKSRGAGWAKTEVKSVALDGREATAEDLAKIREEGLHAWRDSK
jgi:CRISPR/Cas system CSM-associated protein Csm3 (group 7 of RAMP superfamily)